MKEPKDEMRARDWILIIAVVLGTIGLLFWAMLSDREEQRAEDVIETVSIGRTA